MRAQDSVLDRRLTWLGLELASDGEAMTGAWFDGQVQPPSDRFSGGSGAGSRTAPAPNETAEYISRERTAFRAGAARPRNAVQRDCLAAISAVPYGETIAYRDLAARIGRPDSVRAAGAATGRNPLSIVVPCHRIVGADGALTGYAGGIERKRTLLALERRAEIAPDVRHAA
jgi:methylated-DNA-[protein]-cysteine S-methyltransferase